MFTIVYKKSENSTPNTATVKANSIEKAKWIITKLGYIVIYAK